MMDETFGDLHAKLGIPAAHPHHIGFQIIQCALAAFRIALGAAGVFMAASAHEISFLCFRLTDKRKCPTA